jgi:hypothetical protein
MGTELCQPFSTPWLKQFDDSLNWMPDTRVLLADQLVPEGQEGADIILEIINEL